MKKARLTKMRVTEGFARRSSLPPTMPRKAAIATTGIAAMAATLAAGLPTMPAERTLPAKAKAPTAVRAARKRQRQARRAGRAA